MIQFRAYTPDDLAGIDLQPVQQHWRGLLLSPGYAESLDVKNMAWTGIEDGRVVGCAGFSPQWKGRVIGWAVFGKITKMAWPAIIKKVKREFAQTLASQDHDHRVEITVPYGFGAGCRLAHLLGFKVEGIMRHYGPDGSDHFLFAQVVKCAP